MTDILIFFLWFILWTGALIGIGAGLFRLLKIKPLGDHQIFEYGLTGFISIILIAGIINFFSAIWWLISVIIMTGGVIAFFKLYPLKFLCKPHLWKYYATITLIFGTILIWFHPVHDTGGYHLVAINWIVSQFIPFGLANLYSRLGFNTTWFLTNACLDQLVFFFHRPLFITNGVLLFLYFSSIIAIFEKSIKTCQENSHGYLEKLRLIVSRMAVGDLFLILSIFPAIDITRRFVSTASPDMPVFFFEIIIISISLNIITNKYSKDNKTHALFLLLIIGLLTVTVKTSAIPILILICGLFIIELFNELKSGKTGSELIQAIFIERKIYLYLCVIVTLIGIFVIRGVILSGNPVFPMPLPVQITFPWSVPSEISGKTLQDVVETARLYGSGDKSLLLHMNWLGHWVIELVKHTTSLIFVWLFAIFGLLVSYYYQKDKMFLKKSMIIQSFFIIICLVFSLLFWFNSAPDPRFGFGFLFSLPLVLLVFPVVSCQKPYPQWFNNYISYVFLAFLVLSVVLSGALILTEGISVPKMPDYSYTIEQSKNGEEIYVSNSWDQNWDMPLPNTPEERYTDLIVEKNHTNGDIKKFILLDLNKI